MEFPTRTASSKHFVDQHRRRLIESVTNVESILEVLHEKGAITQEAYDKVASKDTNQEKMRELYPHLKTKKAKDVFCNGLQEYETDLLEELQPSSDEVDHSDRGTTENDSLTHDELKKQHGTLQDETQSAGASASVLSADGFDQWRFLPNLRGAKAKTECYSLTNNPRGICLIINNDIFNDGVNRPGTQKDEEALRIVFSRLGFKVEVCNNLTAQGIRDVLKELGKQDFTNADALVVCVLSHGLKGCVFGTDGGKVFLNELKEPFRSWPATTLAGKPKLFFIQACQGSGQQEGLMMSDCPSNKGSQLKVVANDADFLMAMATVEGFVSVRDYTGSVYIQELCKQLTTSAERGGESILDILTRVNLEVSKTIHSVEGGTVTLQIPEPKYTLTKKVILKFI